ncbi:MAG TPA: M28 family peptidase, partial [Terriglobales bacterium]|nr:M28 family peptidase [Terriglobales bacterium]
NQSTAWSGLDRTLVRWGHMNAREPAGFAFMVSRDTADSLRARLKAGEKIVLHAQVKATVGPGHWTVVTGTIPGSDANAGEIVYSCHLDHERPGANDNGSGCVTILESARILARLVSTGAIPKPLRTLRFIWGPEVEGTMAYLASHPEVKKELRADIHMDMVGGDPFKNKSIFHVTATPWSLPSFVTDVGEAFLNVIKAGASNYAASGADKDAAVIEDRNGAPGTRNEFIADVTPYSAGSDHDDYDSSTIAVPSLYLRDWPDIYIHTDHDTLQQIDPTKLRRVALLGAALGYAMATMDRERMQSSMPILAADAQESLVEDFKRAQLWVNNPNSSPEAAWYEARNLMTQSARLETLTIGSAAQLTGGDMSVATLSQQFDKVLDTQARARGVKSLSPSAPWANDPAAKRIPIRIAEFGPLTYQNDDVLAARLGRERVSKIKLLSSSVTPMLSAEDLPELYAYEIVNFVNGERSVGEIRDAVSAEFGPISVDVVADYLDACVEAKIIAWK